jgi:hypothetical protein
MPRGGAAGVASSVIEKTISNKNIIVGFVTTMITHLMYVYNKEIVDILTNATVVSHASFGKGNISNIIKTLVKNYKIDRQSQAIQKDVFERLLTREGKITLFREKLKFMVFGTYKNKKKESNYRSVWSSCLLSHESNSWFSLHSVRSQRIV